MEKILAPVALPGEGMALLGFTPTKPWEKPCMIVEDDFLFVLEEKQSIFTGEHLRMPILSHD